MKLAIKLVGFDPVPVPYETEFIAGFPKQSADDMCKRINDSDDPLFKSHHWIVEKIERGGEIRWLIVSDA